MIAENLKIVEDRIEEICLKSGRNRSEIRLIGVSKTQPVQVINEAIEAGIKDLGENKAQELRDKSDLIQADISWHFIGHLQSNKVKFVIKSARYIHSVDSVKLADEINRKAESINKIQNVLLEINTSSEASKFGLKNEDEIFETARFCQNSRNLKLAGLMTMAPYTDDKDILRKCFVSLRLLKDNLNTAGFDLTELSMGMTNDYEIAIEEGATMIRIGTAIFGERNYK
ncbi:MAG TPA: YggS family pyridoxal phosphate-dependent enzyme [Melioribacteraceae bacterium]|nr:YggS family pyridoxal phosphate-dependent enzyme [Melioribacteraceae bacterium]